MTIDKKSIAHKFASFIIKRPFVALAIALVLIALFVPGLQKMQADFSYRIWFNEDDPLLKEYDAFERRFGNDETVVVIVHSPNGIFDKETVSVLQGLTADLWLVPEVIRVDSLSNYNWTHSVDDDIVVEPLLPDDEPLTQALLKEREQVAMNHELLPGYLISKDGKSAIVMASIKPSFEGSPDYDLIINGRHDQTMDKEGVKDKIMKYAGTGDHVFHVTGSGAISDAFREASIHDMTTLVPLLLGVIVMFILILMRRVSALFLSFGVIILTLIFTFGFAGLAGIKFNNVIATLPNTLIAISIADAIHILVTFFQFRRSGAERNDAVYKTFVKNLQPTFLTSFSTAVGFASFFSAKVLPISNMGFLAAVGVMGAWVITIFFVGPMLRLLPLKVKVKETNTAHKAELVDMTEPRAWAWKFSGLLDRFRVPIIAVSIIVVVVSAYVGLQNEVNSDPFKYFPEGFHLRTANDFMVDNVGGATGVDIMLDAGKPDGIKEPEFLQKVETFQQWLSKYPHVTSTVSIIDILKQMNRSLHNDNPAFYKLPETKDAVAQQLFLYTMSLPQGMDLNDRMTIDHDAMRLTMRWTLSKSTEATEAFAIIKAKAENMGLKASLTGKTTLYQSMNGYVVSSFITSLTIAIFFIGLLMVITFRSLKTGLLSMIPNVVPLIFGAGLMTILEKPLDIGTVIVTSICLGIAVDDTIHFLTNYYKYTKAGYDSRKAVAMVFSYTGPALLVTTLILVSGFGIFAFAFFVPNINFGILTALILSSALLTDVILLPVILMMGRRQESKVTKGRSSGLKDIFKRGGFSVLGKKPAPVRVINRQ